MPNTGGESSMKFSTAKIVMLVLLLAAFSIAAVGTLCMEKNSSLYNLALGGVILLTAAGLSVGAIWSRCPHCGRRLFFKVLKWKKCPKCGHPLK